MSKPSFTVLKAFLLSWGLAPSEEPEETISYAGPIGMNDGYYINSACYVRMKNEGRALYEEDFVKFLTRYIEATDGAFYISWNVETWADLEEEYNQEY